MIDKHFKLIICILILSLIGATIWANYQVYKYGEAKYKLGRLHEREFCLQLKSYNYEEE